MNSKTIEQWFENYDKWVHQYERAKRLGIAWSQEDKILKKSYTSLEELDLKAEEMKVLLKKAKEDEWIRYLEWRKARDLEV